ncbi:Gypsy retrotransposon integrase-like protein 1 [Argiope bruennichi]|uniref:RNA-directed DNA polymerase n=1 Tax=Argiope bruennichi TaxID=94029 RepID=A0A8T0ETN5_ARGBR|nr:Gypsy retrotransposon integrase-like protein 1 [Argiope bruennichi]
MLSLLVHKRGGENAKGDGKARRIERRDRRKNEIEPEMQLREERSLPPHEIGEGAEDLFTPFKITQEEFSKAQMDCGTLEECRERVNKGHEGFKKEKGLFFRVTKDHLGNPRSQLIVPKKFRPAILEMCHESTSAHLGVTKTKDRALKYYFWPNCVKDIENYVRSCDPCQRIGKPREKTKAPLKLVPVISEIFSKLNIDCVGPLPISEKNNRYLLTAMCMSSKYPDAIPIEDLTSITVINAMLNVFSRMGFPREIQCDWGTSFIAINHRIFDKFGIKSLIICAASPDQNPERRAKPQIFHVNLLKPYHKRLAEVNLVFHEEKVNVETENDLEIAYPTGDVNAYDFEEISRSSNLEERLTTEQIGELKELLHKHKTVFSNKPGKTHLVEHDIELISNQPVRSKPYRTSQRQAEILKSEIKQMLDLKIIEMGQSDLTSPMLLVEHRERPHDLYVTEN